jgi:hypothetical protein
MPKPPIILRLSPALLAFANPWPLLLMDEKHFASAARLSQTSALRMSERFLFKNDEKAFVRELLFRKSNFWIFRSDQQSLCGDFVVVDMASPWAKLRPVAVIDLKQGAALKLGGGGAGIQFKNASLAVQAIAKEFAIISAETPITLISGDKEAILKHWGIHKP